MFKITLYDNNCSPICDGVTRFFTDSIEDFENNWEPYASKEQLERFRRSKAGEIVTDYYSENPKLNIVQEDNKAEILFEKEIVFEDKQFTLLNAYGCESKIYAAKTVISYKGIKFLDEYYLIGKYQMYGVCENDIFKGDDDYITVRVWGNPVINVKVQEKETWYEASDGRKFYSYKKEDFKEDYLETYCYVTVGCYTEKELFEAETVLASDEMMICLLRDIPGEAG